MSDLNDLYPAEMQAQIEAQEAAEAASESEHGDREAQIEAFEMSVAHEDRRAGDLANRQIGDWTVVGHKRNAQGRNVFVLRHRDGFMKGVKGHVLNAMLTDARRNGVPVT